MQLLLDAMVLGLRKKLFQFPKNIGPARSFDLILCHNILEYCDEPGAVLQGAAHALRDASAILSILVRNQAGEVLKAAIQTGDLAAAEKGLTSQCGQESLYGGKVRLFTPESLRAMLTEASLAALVERGVLVLADYLPAKVSRTEEYKRIVDLERKLGRLPEYAAVARLAQNAPELLSYVLASTGPRSCCQGWSSIWGSTCPHIS